MAPGTLQPRITKISIYIRTDILVSRTGYDVTNYFRSDVTAKIPSKMPPKTAQVEFLENGLSEDHQIPHGCQ